MAANNIGVLGGFVLSTLSYNHLGMNFLCLLSICSGVPAILLSFGIKEQKTKTVKIVPKTSDLIKVYADKRLIFFSILALVQQGILMATCMSFTTQIAHEINASAFQIGLLSIVYIIVAVLASYFSASNFARRLGSSLWIPISTEKILGLRRLEINDFTWNEAMKAITESITVEDSKRYIRFYERREKDGKYEHISLSPQSL